MILICNYLSTIQIHLERKNKCGGGICVFIHQKLNFKRRVDLSISDDANEILSIEIINKRTKNTIINTCYRPPGAKIKPFKKQLTHVFEKLFRENKILFIVRDFNVNSLDYSTNTKVKNFINHMFSNGILSVINKPRRITKNSVSCINYIYTNSYFNQDVSSNTIRTDLWDHFPIFIIDNYIKTTNFPDKITKQITMINKKNVATFKEKLLETD